MQIIDISVTLKSGFPVWVGDTPVEIERVSKIEDGAVANVSRLVMSAHTGTHVDAPYHFIHNGGKVDALALDVLVGRAQVIEIPVECKMITLQEVKGKVVGERVLFKTANSAYWQTEQSVFHTDYVAIAEDAAQYLVQMGVRLIGIDYFSVAPFSDPTPVHKILLGAGVILLETLDLSKVVAGTYELICLPLKLGGADGAPARAVLVQN